MDISSIESLIGSFGFPIIACCFMAQYIYETDKKHRNEISELIKVIENNTNAVMKLYEILGLKMK